ncbi:MAG: hypothetical protein ACM3ZC_10245 [Bacteroidota bacterium]
MRILPLFLLCVIIPVLVVGCGLPAQPPQEDPSQVTKQIEKVEEIADSTAADQTLDDIEEAVFKAGSSEPINLATYLPAGYPTDRETVANGIPSDSTYTRTRTGNATYGDHTVVWTVYGWDDGRWEKKVERSVGGEVLWARYIKTEPKVISDVDGTITREFSASNWDHGNLVRYATGTHTFDDDTETTATVNSTVYQIRWRDTNGDTVLEPTVIWRIAHTVTFDSENHALIANSISKIKEPVGEVPWSTFNGERTWNRAAVGDEIFFHRWGAYTYNDQDKSPLTTDHTIYGNRTQRIVRTKLNPDDDTGATNRVITLYFDADGSSSETSPSTVEIRTLAGDLVETVATLTWDMYGDGLITYTDGGGSVPILIHIPRWLR